MFNGNDQFDGSSGFGSGGSGFGGGNQPQSRFKTLFDSSGKPTTVFDSGPHTLTVSGADTTCGTHFKSGNTVFGRDGVHTVVEAGSLKTVLGPHGEMRTIYQNGHDGTIL